MSGTSKALVAVDSGIDRDVIRETLPTGADVQIVGLVEGLDESWRTLQEVSVDVLVVACAGASDRAMFLIEGAIKQQPERPVVVLTQASPNGFVRRMFEAGADDILTLPQTPEQLRFAIQKAVARKDRTSAASGIALASLMCVLGPKGGTGKTLTACNVAVGLADAGKRVVLVDLDLQFGDVGLALGLAPDRTLYDLAKAGGTIDGEKVATFLTTHSSGLQVLMAPTRPDQAGIVTVDFLRDTYAALRSISDFVVVDTPPGFTPEVIASVDSSSSVCMVATLDSLSLKNTKLGFETLELMGYERDRIRFVLNRADSRVGIDEAEAAEIVGRRPDITVPSDREIACAVNEGTPIVLANERSDAARAFRALAAMYLADNAATAEAAPSVNGHGRFRRLLRRGS
jgi:pilus assembly protein CpaE